MPTGQPNAQIRKGSTEAIALAILKERPMHGWELRRAVVLLSEGKIEILPALLYPTLRRMENRGLVTTETSTTSSGHACLRYTITQKGLQHFSMLRDEWIDFVSALFPIIGASITDPVEEAELIQEYTPAVRDVEQVQVPEVKDEQEEARLRALLWRL